MGSPRTIDSASGNLVAEVLDEVTVATTSRRDGIRCFSFSPDESIIVKNFLR
jgi:hypothetical protein